MKSLKCSYCRNQRCCKFKGDSGFAFVGITNARRIRAKTGKEFGYFLDYSPLPTKVVARLMHGDPALEGAMRYSQLNARRILRLKAKKNGDCIFLDSKGKCTIYGVRPNVCRMFPFWAMRLISGRIKVIEHGHSGGCIKPILKGRDIESALPKSDVSNVKKLFRNIEREYAFYKRNIGKFAKKLE